jgi:hypothetical protein
MNRERSRDTARLSRHAGMVKAFADRENFCGTEFGWHIRKQGSPHLSGCDERVQCIKEPDHVHIMLDA